MYTHTYILNIFIQAWFRRRLSRASVLLRWWAVTVLSAAWKGVNGRRLFLRKRAAASRIATTVWMWRHVRLRKGRTRAATVISAWWRGHCTRQNVGQLRQGAAKLQKWFRTQKACANALDIMLERWAFQKRLKREIGTWKATVIQRAVRTWLLRRRGLLRVRRAATAIQACYRTWRPRREVALRRAVAGPRLSRLPSLLVALVQDQHGRLTRHRHFRAREPLAKRKTRLVKLHALPPRLRGRLEVALEPLQAFVKTRRKTRALVRIQAAVRGRQAHQRLRRRREEAARLQAAWRWHHAKVWAHGFQLAAARIQAAVRGHRERTGRAPRVADGATVRP